MGPIYFFPNARRDQLVKPMSTQLDRAFVAARGVEAAFVGVRNVNAQTSCQELPGKGPGGQSGVLIQVLPAGGDAPPRLGFHPEFQQWYERPAGCDCWVGIDREHPTPSDLLHTAKPTGTPLELGDGNSWRIPIVRCPFGRDALGRSQLPRDFAYDSSGQFQTVRSADSDALWELSGLAWDHFFANEGHPTVELEQMVELVLQSLALN